MALGKSGAEEALDVVKDTEKFKDRLAELAKMEKNAKAALQKSTETNKRVFAEQDAKVKEADKYVADAKERAKQIEAGANQALTTAQKLEAELAKKEKDLIKREDKVREAAAVVKQQKEELQTDRAALIEQVAQFKKAAEAACNGIV
jgi:hypothetical protein